MIALMLTWTMLGTVAAATGDGSADPRVEEAKAVVMKDLKDPDSAQFRDVAIVQNSLGESAVCGHYNARNSYGGYEGFKPFGVVGNASVTDVAELERLGCLGIEAEAARRQRDAQLALTARFRAEADFNCNVIWTLMENHFRNGESVESVLDAAMIATENHVRESGGSITPPVLQMIRTQYEQALVKTSAEKAQVKSIRRGDGLFKTRIHHGMYTPDCSSAGGTGERP